MYATERFTKADIVKMVLTGLVVVVVFLSAMFAPGYLNARAEARTKETRDCKWQMRWTLGAVEDDYKKLGIHKPSQTVKLAFGQSPTCPSGGNYTFVPITYKGKVIYVPKCTKHDVYRPEAEWCEELIAYAK